MDELHASDEIIKSRTPPLELLEVVLEPLQERIHAHSHDQLSDKAGPLSIGNPIE